MRELIKALVVEDSDSDYGLLEEYSKELSFPISLDRASSVSESEKKLNDNTYDIIFLDLHLDDSEGSDTVKTVKKYKENSKINNETNIVVMTGTDDWAMAKETLKIGAKDYLKKEDIDEKSLARCINYAMYHKVMPDRKKKGFFGF